MSPEQADGQLDRLGPASDVYSLGAVLYELLTGGPPFAGPLDEVLRQVTSAEPVRPGKRVPGTSPALEAVCLRAMAKDPRQRYPSASELAREVERWLADEPVQAWREPLRLRAGRWVRRHQTLVAALAASLLVMLLLGGAVALWQGREQARRRSAAEAALEEVDRLAEQAHWLEARGALDRAEARLGEAGTADLRHRLARWRADLDLVDRLERIRLERARVVSSRLDHGGADSHYARAFAEAGLGEVGEDEETVARRVAGSVVHEALVAALDDWAGATRDAARRAWVLRVARRADPHPWRDRLRDPAAWQDPKTLARLVGQAPTQALTPHLAAALGLQLPRTAEGEAVLREARRRWPGDFWLNHYLGSALAFRRKIPEAEGYFQAALALRPDTAVSYGNLGVLMGMQGSWVEAEKMYLRCLEIDPGYVNVRVNLGRVLYQQGKKAQAEQQFRRAIERDPKHAAARAYLGQMLREQGKWAEAEKLYGQTLALDPGNVEARGNLGLVLLRQGKWVEGEKQLRRTIGLAPKNAGAHNNLGWALAAQGRLAEARSQFRKALAIDPRHAWAATNLGEALQLEGRWAEAERWHRQAITVDPRIGSAHSNLGLVLQKQGRWAEAAASYKKALAVDPKNGVARTHLPQALRLAALEPQLAAVLEGKYRGKSNDERLDLALLCKSRRLYRTAAGLYAEAGHRFQAACSAALAGCGKGEDASKSDEEKARLRGLALAWLQAELAVRRKQVKGDKAAVRKEMQRWQNEADLAGVRDKEAQAVLPEAERRAWEKLWADVVGLLARTDGK